MVDQHDRPRARRINEKADSFWSAPRSEFLVQYYVFRNIAGLDYKPRLARISCNFRIPAKAKSGQFLVRTQIKFFRATFRFLYQPRLQQHLRPGLRPGKADSFRSVVQYKKYGSLKRFSQRFLERLALIILPHPTFSERHRKKKADSFWSAPMSEKMRKFLGLLGACQEF
jgi:hypothetical protein